jgi:hypothetical protein
VTCERARITTAVSIDLPARIGATENDAQDGEGRALTVLRPGYMFRALSGPIQTKLDDSKMHLREIPSRTAQ